MFIEITVATVTILLGLIVYDYLKTNNKKKAFCPAHEKEGQKIVSLEQTRRNTKWENIETERRKLR